MKTIVEVAQNLIKPFINSEDKKYAANIAPVETSPATAAHTAGTQLIYNGVLYNVTANIAADDPLATTGAGANIAVADKVTEQISSQKQALSDEVVTRSELGAHNLLMLSLARIKEINTAGTWSRNTYTLYDVIFTINSDFTISVSGTASAAADLRLNRGNLSDFSGMVLSGNPLSDNNIASIALYRNGSPYTYYVNCNDATEKTVSSIPSGEEQILMLRINSGKTVSNVKFSPMIRLATDADTTYRPYVPTNAQLLSYKDNGVLGAKNFLKNTGTTRVVSGVTFTVNDDKSITISGSTNNGGSYVVFEDASNPIVVPCDSKFTLGGAFSDGNIEFILTKSDNTIYTLSANAGYEKVIPAGNYKKVHFYFNQNRAGTYTVKPMITVATDTDPTYQPYAMTNRELTEIALGESSDWLTNVKLYKRGNVVFCSTSGTDITVSAIKAAIIPNGFRQIQLLLPHILRVVHLGI